MDWLNAALVSFSMAADCMAVSAADGIREPQMKKWKIALIVSCFGLFQGLMPIIGYFIGHSFEKYLKDYIPWIAFALLTILAIKSLVDWILERRKAYKIKKGILKEAEVKTKEISVVEILTQAVATSIDALSIGFVYLTLPVGEAMGVFAMIAGITLAMSFIVLLLALFLGKAIGKYLIDWIGLISALIFFAVGLKILLESMV